MPEYLVRLLPLIAAACSLTPTSATIYTAAQDHPANAMTTTAPDAAKTQTWGATYDTLTGTFSATSSLASTIDPSGGDCGDAECAPAADTPPSADQPAMRQTAASGTMHSADAGAALSVRTIPSATAVSAASNWYATTLISDAYAYNGNNNAFLLDSSASYLPTMPDFNSWALMFGGMIAVIFLMRRIAPPTIAEPDAVEQAWGGPETRAMELRGPPVAMKAKAAAAVPKLCCSRQALPGS